MGTGISSFKGILDLAGELAGSTRRARWPLLQALRAVPYPLFNTAAAGLTRLEYRLRHPWSSAAARAEARGIFAALDTGGRLGLSSDIADQCWDYAEHVWASDMGTLLLHLPDPGFRSRSLFVENWQAIDAARSGQRGAIIAAPHLGPHGALPLILAQGGNQVAVLGSSAAIASGQRLAESCLPAASSRIQWLPVEDRRALLRARSVLRRGELVVGFMDLAANEGMRLAEVTFLGRKVRVGYGLPHLAALTGCSIVPAFLVREPGPRFTLHLDEPLPAPDRNRKAVRRTIQELFRRSEKRVLEHPDQWLGWRSLDMSGRTGLPQSAEAASPVL